MKTINKIFTTFGILCLITNTLQAQSGYYSTTKIFYQEGYTYQCDVLSSGLVDLYNKNNQYTNERYQNKDGSQVSSDVLLGNVNLIEKDGWTRKKCDEIANKHFSNEDRKRVGNKEYQIVMTVDTSTGKVIGVLFNFHKDRAFATIPVSTYRKIELDLKNSVWFTPTAEGRKLKFIKRGWMQKVKP